MLTENFKMQFHDNAFFQINDNITRNKLQDMFPIICSKELNPSAVINNNAIRFILNDILYEYTGKEFKRINH